MNVKAAKDRQTNGNLNFAVLIISIFYLRFVRQVTCIVRERQLHLYGHVARLPVEDPAHRILPCRYPSGWTMPRGRPHASWLHHVESHLKDTGMAGVASVWAMARRRPI